MLSELIIVSSDVADEINDDDARSSKMIPVENITGIGPHNSITTLNIWHKSMKNEAVNDYINLDAATKGNDPGGHLRIVCDGSNFLVSGILVGDGTLGTPFADAES